MVNFMGSLRRAGRLVIINKPNQAGEACEPRYIYFDFKGECRR